MVTGAKSGHIAVWKGLDKNLELDTIKQGDSNEKNMEKFRQNPVDRNLFATCGKENMLQLWDLEKTDVPVFQGKNVRNFFVFILNITLQMIYIFV